MKKINLIAIMLVLCTMVYGQEKIHVKGRVVNEHGGEIEYVSIGVKEDSIGTVTDRYGRFSMDIPRWKHADITLTHIAYKSCIVPFETYCNRRDSLVIHMKEDEHKVGEFQITGNKGKTCTIKGCGVKWPHVIMGFNKLNNKGKEVGTVINTHKKTFIIKEISIPILSCQYSKCILRLNVYDITEKGTFHNIMQKPLYIDILKTSKRFTQIIRPEEHLVLEPKKKYYVSLEYIDAESDGSLYFPIYSNKSYLRYQSLGKFKSIPANIGMKINGIEIDEE